MKTKKNRRTLKKRIRRIMALSSMITVLIINGLLISLIYSGTSSFARYQAKLVSQMIYEDIASGHAALILRIPSIEELNADNTRTDAWINSLLKGVEGINSNYVDFMTYIVRIELQDRMVYSNETEDLEGLSGFFKNTEAKLPITDANDQVIGSISVRVNPKLLIIVAVPIVGIILYSILTLIINRICNIFLTYPIIKPIKHLEMKMKAIADGDHETANNAELYLKKPLREIESLAESTNSIMRKLQGYNYVLEYQKETLEAQNEELEAQNEELTKSKHQIQEQQAQLIQTEKMASVGLLTAAITHEINTPIGAISSNSQLEDMVLTNIINHPLVQGDEELSSLLSQLKEANDINLMACSRISEIIKSLKSFSRLDQADFQEADIKEGIKSVLVLTHNLLKNRITVHEDYEDIGPVKCSPGQLNQVIMNIIVNASQAIEGEGEIFIKTYKEDEYVFITIRDTGSGIKEEDIPRVFDPGFTTKGVGLGLGLGLYISYNIIQNHNGTISVSSELGKGSEFRIKIPIENEYKENYNII